MSVEHSVIIVPGLRDNLKFTDSLLKRAANKLNQNGLETIIHRVSWHDGEKFDPKLRRMRELIDEEVDKGRKVSLVGLSAGGSAVLNAFSESPEKIDKVVSIAGRLREGGSLWMDFARRSASSSAFRESVTRFQEKEDDLTDIDRARVLIMRSALDFVVPYESAGLKGANNIELKWPFHPVAIHKALSSNAIVEFLKTGRTG